MIDFKTWKTLNESLIGSSMLAGFTTPTAMAVMGAQVGNEDALKAEAGKNPEPPKMDDDQDDIDDEDMPKKGRKCSCEDDDGDEGDLDDDGDEETQEESYFGNGLEPFFCNCGSNDPKDGMCSKCNKYVVSESYNINSVVNEALKWHKGEGSALYGVASYALKNYDPGDMLCESAVVEVDDLIKKSKSRSDTDAVKQLAVLRYKLSHLA